MLRALAVATVKDCGGAWIMRILLPAYAVLALRRAYAVGWLKAFVAAAALVAAILVVNLYLYRAIQFMVTFALT
jgi:type III secretory pathway component EscR